ncbi:cobalamin biosynthesis protein [Sulfitobacter sp. MF3-043]|uniref:cobalamin biosynthesis protein n=1 Tax=Sulfitobacter sediminivivens TaxID=3252902 RepID=UPI0036D80B1D
MRFAGIGFRGAADLASLQDALQKAISATDGGAVDALVSEAAKAREKVFRELAQAMRIPGMGVTQTDMAQMLTPTQSARIQDKFGTGSLAEAAALVAAGPGARLLAERVISSDGMATAAIAEN